VHKHGIEAARKFQNQDFDGAIEQIRMVQEPSGDVLRLLDEILLAAH
jgi:methyl-accepting chemotaxis protein